MMKTAALAITALLASTTIASADDGSRSESTATTMSVLGSAVSLAAVYGGIASGSEAGVVLGATVAVTAPAWGHYYAGDYWTAGTGMRIVGLGAATVGAVMALGDAFDAEESGRSSSGDAGGTLVVGGALLFVGGMIADIATAGGAARDFNNSHQLSAAPLAIKDTHGQTTAGFAVTGSF